MTSKAVYGVIRHMVEHQKRNPEELGSDLGAVISGVMVHFLFEVPLDRREDALQLFRQTLDKIEDGLTEVGLI